MIGQKELSEIIALLSSTIAGMESRAFDDETFGELTMRQVFYLDKIMRMGSPTFSEIADACHITKPSVSAIVSTLMRKGFVEKMQDADDKRVFHVAVTEKGREFDKLHQQVHQRMADALLSGLDEEEINTLTKILRKAITK